MTALGWLAAALSERPQAVIAESSCTRRHASECTLCADACPHDAIALQPHGARVDAEACVGCGLCLTACPVEAVSGVGQKPVAVAARIADGHRVRCDVARMLRDDEEPSVDVPCLAAVHSEAIAAGALAASKATLQRGPCDVCPVGSRDQVAATLDAAREILAATPGQASLVVDEVIPDGEPTGKSRGRQRPAQRMSRRGLLRAFAPEKPAAPERPSSLDELDASASARTVLLASEPGAALPALTATDACTACAGCVRICPTGALDLRDGVLSHRPRACVDCRECVRICPESALSSAGREPQEGWVQLVAVAPATCERCGRRLGPGEQGRCHSCVTRASIVDDVWKHL